METTNTPLATLPPELLIHIFIHLSDLSDVLSLAATSCRLRLICSKNATSTYNHVGPRIFPFRQGGADLEDGLSLHDIAAMLRNWRIIEVAIPQFERQIVRWVRCE